MNNYHRRCTNLFLYHWIDCSFVCSRIEKYRVAGIPLDNNRSPLRFHTCGNVSGVTTLSVVLSDRLSEMTVFNHRNFVVREDFLETESLLIEYLQRKSIDFLRDTCTATGLKNGSNHDISII